MTSDSPGIRFDEVFLEKCGLAALPWAQRSLFLKHCYDTLELRVGEALTDQLSVEQLDEFERLFIDGDDAGRDDRAKDWLEDSVPGYRALVREKYNMLIDEVHALAPRTLNDRIWESNLDSQEDRDGDSAVRQSAKGLG